MTGAVPPPNIVYVLPDKMGGMMNIVRSLIAHRDRAGMPQHVVLTHNRVDARDTRFAAPLGADTQVTVEYALPVENLHAVLRRLRRALPPGGGVLVSNDLLELALLHVHDPGRMVVQILHGDHDYYYDLAERHQAVIDVFVAYGRTMFETLRRRMPDRRDDILHLPYGIPLPARARAAAPGPLRLLFSGRLEHGQKGVLDLPRIDAALAARAVPRAWTIIGDGPDAERLREAWPAATPAEWLGARGHDEVLARLPDFDVFVLPTRAEGFPVALVEAMAAGLVPVVSDITGGVPEVVDETTGYRPAVGDVAGFADAIAALAADRARLDAMSRAARAAVARRFDARARAADYEALFRQWRERRRPRPSTVPLPYGSRLDQPWIPNAVVRAIRTASRRRLGKPV
ncbi:MAG: glycosyltransferase family 4 protein [Acidobacteriota bacterium]